MKSETKFRIRVVDPFLATLEMTHGFSIQQVSLRGTPDKLICIRGRFVALELKSRGGILSKLQRWNLERVKKAGGVALVADPDNWPEVRAELERLAQGDRDD